MWLSSADWMGRNMFRRVEVAFPVRDQVLRKRVVDEGLRAYLADNVDAWELDCRRRLDQGFEAARLARHARRRTRCSRACAPRTGES